MLEEPVAAVAKLDAEHYRRAGAFQRLVSAATPIVVRPRKLALITFVIASWVSLTSS